MTINSENVPYDENEIAKLIVVDICNELLEQAIPDKLRKSVLARLAIESAVEDIGLREELDGYMYVTKDYLTDKVPSYRMRFVPHELRRNLDYVDGGKVRRVVINIPLPFITDPLEPSGIELALVSFTVIDDEVERTDRFIVTSTGVIPYTDFATLDFFYEQLEDSNIENNFACSPEQVLKVSDSTHPPSALSNHIPYTEQKELVELVYETLHLYALGRQSRTDNTILG